MVNKDYIYNLTGGCMTSLPGLHGWSRLQSNYRVLQMMTTTDTIEHH